MKKILSILAVLLCMAAIPKAYAYNFESGGIYYDITSPNTVAVTYATGSYNSYSGTVDIPSTVTYNGTTYTVTAIGNSAFCSCSNLTGVTIPGTVTSIGYEAFYNCGNLHVIDLPDGLTNIGEYAFSHSGLYAVTIPSSVTSIGSQAFSTCNSLTSAVFYASNCTSASSIFYNCSLLSSLTIGNNVHNLPSDVFTSLSALRSVTVPNSVTSMGSNPFSNCSNLDTIIVAGGNSVFSSGNNNSYIVNTNTHTLVTGCKRTTIPSSVTAIGDYAFSGCTGLTGTLTIPDQITVIGASAFYECTGLIGVLAIPNQITVIGASAFQGCTGLTSLTIGYAVDSIGNSAFSNCSRISSVAFNADSCRYMGSASPYDIFSGCSNFSTLTIGNNVKAIPPCAFYGCNHLTGMLVIPNSVKTIGTNAFRGCNGFTSLSLGNSVTSIGNSAFYLCSNIGGALTIPQSVKSIGSSAFNGCTSFSSIIFIADSCTTGSFSGCSNVASLTIGDNVKVIPGYAFYHLSHITGSLTIPNSVVYIGNFAFNGCGGLNTLTIGKSVKTIENGAFQECTNLSSVTFNADSCTYMGYHNNSVFNGCPYLASLTIGENVKHIPPYAFYNLIGLTGTLSIPDSITSIGDYAFRGCSSVEGKLTIHNSVKTIGYYAFAGCTSLDSVIIGRSVTSMHFAFSGCTGLTYVAFNADSCNNNVWVNAFDGSSNISTITIGDNVTIIPHGLFSGCSGISGCVTIPNSVVIIGEGAFSYCSGIDSLIIGKSVVSIMNLAFSNCNGLSYLEFNADSCISTGGYNSGQTVFGGCTNSATLVIGDNVKIIPNNAFSGFTGLQGSLIIPDSVVSIGERAFYGCSGLDSLIVGKAVSSISYANNSNNSAFKGCSGLTYVEFNADSCAAMGNSSSNYVFSGCKNIAKVIIGNNVKAIPDYAFYYCTSLSGQLIIPDSVKYIGKYAFSRCSGIIDTLNIPNMVVSLGEDAFFGCSNISSLIIGEKVRSVGNSAFYGCSLLSSIIYNADSCTHMGGSNSYDRVFYNCNAVSSLTIGDNVKFIPDNAFYPCNGLTSIYSYNEIPPTLTTTASNVFYNVRNTPVYVPCGSSQAYRNAWTYSSSNTISYFNNIYGTLVPYTFDVSSEDTLKGTVQVTTQPTCSSPAVIEATPKFFYIFDHWSDGSTENPRSVTLSQDTTLVAYFREYTLTINCDTAYGHVVVLQAPTAENPLAVVEVIPDPCYLFSYWEDISQSGWSVGYNYDNPRTLTITQDTTISIGFYYAHPVSILSENTSICEGDSTVLRGFTYAGMNSVTVGYLWGEYMWDSESDRWAVDTICMADSLIVTTTGTFVVIGIDSSGCTAEYWENVEVRPYPTIMISGRTDICEGDSTTITVGLYEFSESFSNGIPNGWTTSGGALETYALNGVGGNAILFPAYNLPENTVAELTLPDLNLKKFDNPYLHFTMLYSGRLSCHYEYGEYGWDYNYVCDTLLSEDLSVMLSTDDGNTWTEVFRASEDYYYYSMYPSSNAYYPSNNSTNTNCAINLWPYYANENVKIKFVFSGGQGNNMWLDNIRVVSNKWYSTSYVWSNEVYSNQQTFNSEGTWTVTASNNLDGYQWDDNLGYYVSRSCSTKDSVTIHVGHPDSTEQTLDIPNSYYVWNNETHCQSGDYTQILQNRYGCDSTVTLHLTLAQRDTTVVYDTVCNGYRYVYANGNSYCVVDIYSYNENVESFDFSNYEGWDDTVYWDCWDGVWEIVFNVSEDYYGNDSMSLNYDEIRHYETEAGCDSIVLIHNTIRFSDYIYYHETACGSYIWYGDTLTSGEYGTNYNNKRHNYVNEQGCDSREYWTIRVLPVVNVDDTVVTCGSSYSYQGFVFTESGTYSVTTDTIKLRERETYPYDWDTHTYDTVIVVDTLEACCNITLYLTLLPVSDSGFSIVSCDSYIWNDSTYTQSGEYTQTFTSSNGCDSVVTLHLTITNTDFTDFTGVACDSYTWNGVTYTASDDYTQTFTNTNGCDSVVTLHLTVNASDHTELTAAACGQYVWKDSTYTESGDYSVIYTNAAGCDSIVTLHLTINPIPEVAITGNTTICPGGGTLLTATGADTYMWSNYSTNASIPVNMFGDYSVTGTSSAGCFNSASVTVLVATPPVITITGNTDLCAGESATLTANGGVTYMWSNGSTDSAFTVNTAGSWQVIGYDENGCNGTASVTVNVWQPATSTFTVATCNSYSWNDSVYTQSGDYTQSLQTVHGCDSVVTLYLTVNHSDSTEFSASACDSYEWNGETYATSGDYTQTLTNAESCDSVVTLHLTINYSTTSDTTAVACESFTWEGETYTESGNYTSYWTNAAGCDSIVTLHLTITVGVDDYETVDFKVYPNPTNGVVNVECIMKNEEWGEVELHLCDAYGRLVDAVRANNHSPLRTAQIDLSQYANGVYFVKLMADDQTIAVRKVVKQ